MSIPACPVSDSPDIKEFKSKKYFVRKEDKDTSKELEFISFQLKMTRKFVAREMEIEKITEYTIIKEFIVVDHEEMEIAGDIGYAFHVHIFFKTT